MHWYVLVGLVAAVVAIAAGLTGAFLMRRHQLRSMLGTFECELQRGESTSWRSGICKYNDHSLEFLKLWSLSPLPALTMTRTSLEIVGRDITESEEDSADDDRDMIVDLDTDVGRVRLGLSYAAYTGLSAWIEAGPVAGVGTWRQ
ncbi:DUF2550 domain-containing protein [Galactobacter sp.]|uniref:DUF2550 domain-containing protein n=1 Tax=Galactobacter sp. TaxID=2676125 RepID=UPI0025C13D05|nr:DUF2550 domain-containing protein [Galactobacter sp.]